MAKESYILLYGDKKPEDNICIPFMFKNTCKIPLGWLQKDKEKIEKIIDENIEKGIKNILFWGLETGWDEIIIKVNKKYSDIKIKAICNTQDSLLYYEYERTNFFKLLELNKLNKVKNIAFLRKGMYETYKKIGYNCSYILENIILDKNKIQIKNQKENEKIKIGIYPLNYTWDKNIFNQLSVGKFIEKSVINYNSINDRMVDFIKTMHIDALQDNIQDMEAYSIANIISKNDIIISCDFTDYVHPIYIIAMESGIPCILGNTSELLDNELQQYLLVSSEDNPIKISEKINYALENKNKISEIYTNWKKKYNALSKESIENFINK